VLGTLAAARPARRRPEAPPCEAPPSTAAEPRPLEVSAA